MLKMFADPIPGLLAFGVILVTLVGNVKIPGKVPGALASALIGIAAFHILRAVHIMSPIAAPPTGGQAAFHLAFPWPTVAFLGGLSLAWIYLPIMLPFSLATVVGGIDNTESAAAAGDVYDTRAILLTEGFCTLLAGLCGGVVESTPYIGHPAYKAMGAGAGYVILTGLFIGLGGILGYLPFFVVWIPAAAIAPILVYIGLEVISQAFLATPARHGLAVAVSLLPSLAFLVALEVTAALGAVGAHAAQLTGDVGETIRTVILLGNGFIISALIWGAATAELLDGRFRRSAWCLVLGALACLFGVIHRRWHVRVAVARWFADPVALRIRVSGRSNRDFRLEVFYARPIRRCHGNRGLYPCFKHGIRGSHQTDARENALNHEVVPLGSEAGHCIFRENQLIGALEGVARGGFDSEVCGNAAEDDRANPAPPQVQVEIRAIECAPLALRDNKIAFARANLGQNFRPVRRKRPAHLKRRVDLRIHCVLAIGGEGDPHQRNDRSAFAKLRGEAHGIAHHLRARTWRPRTGNDSLLKINQNQCRRLRINRYCNHVRELSWAFWDVDI